MQAARMLAHASLLLHRPCMYACISCIFLARQVEQSSHRMHCVYALHTSHHACISPRWQDANVASHARSRHRQRHVACRCACSQAIMHRKRLTQHCFACNAGTPGRLYACTDAAQSPVSDVCIASCMTRRRIGLRCRSRNFAFCWRRPCWR